MADDDFSLSTIVSRLAGHAWDDIHDFVDGGQQAALEAGYSQEDIDQYLGRNSPNGLMSSLDASWRVRMAADPDLAKPLQQTQPGPVAPLDEIPAHRMAGYANADATPPTEMPSEPQKPSPLPLNTPEMRGHYADALIDGSVRSPQDFAERYAGTFWGAAGGNGDHGAAVTGAAHQLAQALPTDDEFTDAAIAIAHNASAEVTPEGVKIVKDNLANEWADTGKTPMELYQKANVDPQFVGDMVTPPKAIEPGPWWANDPEALSAAEASSTIAPFLADHFSHLIDNWSQWSELQQGIADRLQGQSLRTQALDPEALDQAINMAFATMTNPIEKIGPALANVIEKLPEPKASVVDPGAPIADAVKEVPISDAVRLPEPAPVEITPGPRQVEPIVAYHGTPHEFDAFSEEHIGTGEGAQAYGHGLYFAENPAVAGGYRDKLTERAFINKVRDVYGEHDDPTAAAHDLMADPTLSPSEKGLLAALKEDGWLGFDYPHQAVRAALHEPQNFDLNPTTQEALNNFGNLYKVHLHVDPETLLDMDKPMSQQSPLVQAAVDKAGIGVGDNAAADASVRQMQQNRTGKEFLDRLQYSLKLGAEGTAQRLQENGVLGTRYLDAGSRGAGEGTSNYVIFRGGDTQIVEKNGKAFAPDTQPAEKIQALARDAQPGTSFVDMAKDQDPATQELARGWDAAGALHRLLFDTLPGVMKDESGSLNLGNWGLHTPEAVAERARQGEARDYAKEAWVRDMVGNSNRLINHYGDMLEPNYPAVMKNMGTWEDELRKGPAGDPMNTPIGVLLDSIEGRSMTAHIDANNALAPLGDTIRNINQQVDKRLRQQAEEGILTHDGYIKDYYMHQWEDPRGIRDAFTGSGALGNRGNLGERTTFPTIADGIRAGYVPKNLNPIEATMADINAKVKYSHAADMLDQTEKDGVGYWDTKPRARGDLPIENSLGTRSRTFPMDVPGSNSGEKILASKEERFYAPAGFSRNINDMLSIGLHGRPSTGSALDKLMWAKNTTTMIKLALPSFHSYTIGLASIASGLGQAMEEIGRGTGAAFRGEGAIAAQQFGSAFMNLGKGATIVPNIAENLLVGRRAIQGYLKMSDDPIINYLTEAGQNFTKPMSPESGYATGTNSIYTSLRRGSLVREITGEAKHIFGDPQTETYLARGAWSVPRTADFALKQLFRFVGSPIASPFFDHAIPMIQAGANYSRLQSWLKAYPTASEAAIRKYASQLTMDSANRMGELNFDTVFAPRVAKQIANAVMISPSWKFGTYRGIGQALGFIVGKWNAPATTSLIGGIAAYGYANALYQYFLGSGQAPWQTDTPFKDFMNGRTGSFTATGQPKRIMFPAEFKEMYDLGHVIMHSIGDTFSIGRGLADYALAALNPAFAGIVTFLTGYDRIGNDVAQQVGGVMKYLKDNFEPIFVNAMAGKKKDTGIPDAALLSGVREASTYVEDPTKYLSQMEGVRMRSQRDQLNRAIREQMQLETPTEDIADLRSQLKVLNQQLGARGAASRQAATAAVGERAPRTGSSGGRVTGGRGGARTQGSQRRGGTPRSSGGLGRQPRGYGRGGASQRIGGGFQGIGGGFQGIGGGAQGI